jgi:hypothetical protein
MLAVMVAAMDWSTGLIAGVTRERLAEAVGRSTRSVSRLWAWAERVELLARVEEGASGGWLGTDRNRAAAFVLVTPRHPAAGRPVSEPDAEEVSSTGFVAAGDKGGNPPASCVSNKPLGRPQFTTEPPWPSFRIPETPSQRHLAATLLVARAGLDATRLDQRRLRGLLKPWWEAGACVAGLLWAIDHHPDHPGTARGDALRGARDPLAVMGFRLSPWTGRIARLPSAVRGLRGDYQAVQRVRLAAATGAGEPTSTPRPASGHTRAAARAALRAHLAERSRRRRTRPNLPEGR